MLCRTETWKIPSSSACDSCPASLEAVVASGDARDEAQDADQQEDGADEHGRRLDG